MISGNGTEFRQESYCQFTKNYLIENNFESNKTTLTLPSPDKGDGRVRIGARRNEIEESDF